MHGSVSLPHHLTSPPHMNSASSTPTWVPNPATGVENETNGMFHKNAPHTTHPAFLYLKYPIHFFYITGPILLNSATGPVAELATAYHEGERRADAAHTASERQ